jgi:four helix bundle protein
MGFKRLEDCHAFQLARAFKRAVYAIVKESPGAMRDHQFRMQIQDALSSAESNIGEGFYRFGAGEMSHFLRIALGSMGEGMLRLNDGVDRGYFSETRCREALQLGDRAIGATRRWRESLEPFVKGNRRRSEGTGRGDFKKRSPPSRSSDPDPEPDL